MILKKLLCFLYKFMILIKMENLNLFFIIKKIIIFLDFINFYKFIKLKLEF